MKTPIWVWDKKHKKYFALPQNGLQQFSNGSWGYYFDNTWFNDQEVRRFIQNHNHLFHIARGIGVFTDRAILKNPGPARYQPREEKARITKVQK